MTEEYPKVDYPTIIEGEVFADTLRLESLTGPELFLGGKDLPVGGWTYEPKAKFFYLNNFKPREINGHMYGLTHQQKQSHRGWLKADPLCNHWWYFFRKQKRNADGGWAAGTEIGKYFRWGEWRWDVAGTMIDGVLRHWIGGAKRTTYINFSLHWD